MIPKETNELLRLLSLQSPYARAKYKFNQEVPHVLICGHVMVSAFKTFCKEYQ